MLTAKVIDRLVAATTDRDGELYGQMAGQLLEPLHERLAFAEGFADDTEIRPVVERLIEASANLTILDSRVLAEDHAFGTALDAIGRFVVDRPEEEKEQQAWQRHLEGLIEQLADLDSASESVLKKIGQDCDGFQKRQRRRAEIAKKRAAQAEAARGRLDDSREAADRIIANMIERLAPPPPIAELLSGPWQNVIVLECVRHGQEAMATTRAIRTAQDLIKWSSRSKPLSDKLRARLVEGLGMVGFNQEEAHRFLDELVDTVRETDEPAAPVEPVAAEPVPSPPVVTEPKPSPPVEPVPAEPATPPPAAVAAPPPPPEEASHVAPASMEPEASAPEAPEPASPEPGTARTQEELPPPRQTEVAAAADSPAPPAPPEPVDAAATAPTADAEAPGPAEDLPPAKPYLNVPATPPAAPPDPPADPSWNIGGVEVRKGDWFEFVREDGDKVRAKLSWVSPISRNLLFVDDRGIKVADMNFDELRANFAAREARLVRELA